MRVTHIDLLEAHDLAQPRIGRWVAAVLGGIGAIALAAVPGAFAVLLLVRPELFLSR